MRIGILVMVMLILAASCGKDEGEAYGDVQMPVHALAGDLPASMVFLDVEHHHEVGCSMEILRNGRIRELCVHLPFASVFRTTLWDLSDQSVIASVNINAASHQTACAQIVEYYVKAGDRLAVTLYSNSYVNYVAEHDGPLYPVTYGDIQILNYATTVNPTGFELPTDYNFFVLGGLVDIGYQPEL